METFKEYKEIKNKNESLTLRGFTSTSLKKDKAFGFLFRGLRKDFVPVLYQINNLSEKGYKHFYLDSEEYSLYSDEKEVLLATGS